MHHPMPSACQPYPSLPHRDAANSVPPLSFPSSRVRYSRGKDNFALLIEVDPISPKILGFIYYSLRGVLPLCS